MFPPQQAAPAAPNAPADPNAHAPEADPAKLHDYAMQLQTAAEQLATGLARLNADPGAVKAVQQCAELGRQIAAGLAKQGLSGATAQAAQPAPPRSIHEATQQMMAPSPAH